MSAGFGETPTEPYLTDVPRLAEMERSLALLDGELVLATSGITTRALPVPDAVRRSVPGNLNRDERWWNRELLDLADSRHGATELRFLLHTEADGTVTGYAAWRMKGTWDDDRGEPDGVLHVEEVRASSTQAY